ncbi:MAG TPA: nucleotidyltransferase family protein [Pyrinomonadaceae bacterium]|nr:nucleotidyltransferase family protein [Pyrinomonadaceae bacterium]
MSGSEQPQLEGVAPPPEVELLLLCARAELREGDARRIRELIDTGPDWDAVVVGALRHALVPLVHAHLNATSTPSLPEEAASRLRDLARRIAAFNSYLVGELSDLLTEFAARGVQAIPYKGPALALEAYGQVSLRQFCDLDIIVRPKDIRAAAEVLRERGYAPYRDLRESQLALMLRTQCNAPFTRDRDRSVVELHWGVCARDFARPLDPEEFWARSRETQFRGAPSRSLAVEDLMLALCVHGSKHRWEQLSWVCDVAQLLRGNPNLRWAELLERAGRCGVRRMLLLGLRLAHGLLDAPLDAALREAIDADAASARLAATVADGIFGRGGARKGVGNYFGFQWAARERASDKLRYCRYALHPTDEDLYSLALPRPLAFAYYAWRPLRMIRTGGPASLRRGVNSDAAR